MSNRDLTSVTCEQCGAEMSLRDSGSRKSLPVIGQKIDWRRYVCPECGIETRYLRKQGMGWKKTSG